MSGALAIPTHDVANPDPTWPLVPASAILDAIPDYETGDGIEQWNFRSGTAADLVGRRQGLSLTPLGIAPSYPGNYVRLAGGAAWGSITLTGLPAAGDTVSIGGSLITFVAGAASGAQVTIGDTAETTAAALASYIKAASATLGVTASAVGASVWLTANAGGVGGNAIALATAGTNLAVSGATLTGGSAGTLSALVTPYADRDSGTFWGVFRYWNLNSAAQVLFGSANSNSAQGGEVLQMANDGRPRLRVNPLTSSGVNINQVVPFGVWFFAAVAMSASQRLAVLGVPGGLASITAAGTKTLSANPMAIGNAYRGTWGYVEARLDCAEFGFDPVTRDLASLAALKTNAGLRRSYDNDAMWGAA